MFESHSESVHVVCLRYLKEKRKSAVNGRDAARDKIAHPIHMPPARALRWALVLAALFAFRLWFGLTREFFFEDETQIFLIGFRYYATGEWPYFGPDVVWTKSEIPGALQGVLVGAPLRAAPYPESPYVALAILSFGALSLFAWYVGAHRPAMPRWLIWGWLFTIPWTIQFSLHPINTSYILPASLVFFVGVFESVPALSLRLIPPAAAHAMMGAALAWLMQIHMSWPLLVPFAALAWASRWRDGVRDMMVNLLSLAAGALVPAVFLLPTLALHGAAAGSGGVVRNLHLHAVSPWIIVTTLARLLSFASLEINRFIATDAPKRLEFFQRHLWLAPLAIAAGAAGVVQPVWMVADAARRSRWNEAATRRRWDAVRLLLAGALLLVYASYFFVVEPPQAHAFYVLAPIVFLFAAYWWALVDSPRSRQIAAAVLALGVLYHAGLAWAQAPELSLYRNRGVVAAAVRLKEPEMFAHRRPFAIGGGPLTLNDPARPYDAARDVQILSAAHRPGPAESVHWSVTLRNGNAAVAFRDLLYVATYVDGRGAIVDERHEFIKDIFEPGDVRRIELNDGYVRAPFASASLRIAAAEALLPLPATISDAERRPR